MSSNRLKIRLLRYFPYLILGSLILYTNSQLNLNYFLRGYLSLLELQIGIVVIFFIASKSKKI